MSIPKTIPVEKHCMACGKPFYVCPPGKKSRYYPTNSQSFCSRQCSGKARYRSGSGCAELSDVDAAYIAGFLDGEGSIFIYEKMNRPRLRVAFANNDLGVLEWISKMTGVGSISTKIKYSKVHATSYILQLNADAALSLLQQVRKYLRIKGEQADLGIDFQERLKIPELNLDRSWQVEYGNRMCEMNKRGPR